MLLLQRQMDMLSEKVNGLLDFVSYNNGGGFGGGIDGGDAHLHKFPVKTVSEFDELERRINEDEAFAKVTVYNINSL